MDQQQKQKDMEAVFATLTDAQRVETLNNIYKKGLSTPSQNLAFSADKLVYVKPFISKLTNTEDQDLTSRIMARSIIDDLLNDIVSEVEAAAVVSDKSSARLVAEYGLGLLVNQFEEDFYYASKVA